MGGEHVRIVVLLGKYHKVIVGEVGGGAFADVHTLRAECVAVAAFVNEREGTVMVRFRKGALRLVEADGHVLEQDDVEPVHGIHHKAVLKAGGSILGEQHPEFRTHRTFLAFGHPHGGHHRETAVAVVRQSFRKRENRIFRLDGKKEIVNHIAENPAANDGFVAGTSHKSVGLVLFFEGCKVTLNFLNNPYQSR